MMNSPALALRVEESHGMQVLDRLGRQLDVLAARLQVPMTSRRTWLWAWVESYPQFRPWTVTAWEAGSLVGACLLAQRRVGDAVEVVALGQSNNDRTHLLALNDDVAVGLAARVAAGLHSLQRPWTLRIEQLPNADPVATAIADLLPDVRLTPGGSIPGVDFSFERSVDAHLSKNLRRQVHKCRNRLATDGVVADISFTRDPCILIRLLDEVEEVHRARDHDVGRTSDIDDAAELRRWRGIIARHIKFDVVEVATMHLDGMLAAYVVSFIDGDTYRVFDGRFLTKWERYSPGRLLETETLAHAMNNPHLVRLDWMNSIATDKLISANALETTMNLVGSSAW